MNDNLKPAGSCDCKVCYVPHNDDIHEATLRVRGWLRQELNRKLSDWPAPTVEEVDPALVA